MGSNATKAVGHRDSDRNLRQIHPSKTGSHRSAKDAFAQNAAVGHAVKRHAAGHAEILRVHARAEVQHFCDQHLLEQGLGAARHILVELCDLGFRLTRCFTEQF